MNSWRKIINVGLTVFGKFLLVIIGWIANWIAKRNILPYARNSFLLVVVDGGVVLDAGFLPFVKVGIFSSSKALPSFLLLAVDIMLDY